MLDIIAVNRLKDKAFGEYKGISIDNIEVKGRDKRY